MLVIVLVLAAAAVGALGLVLLRKATQAEPERPQFSLKLLWLLIRRRPVWAGGIVTLAASFVLQGIALANGPVSQVQLVIVMELPFALILSRLVLGGRLRAREWSAIVAMTLGVAVVLLTLSPAGGDPKSVNLLTWLLGLGVTAAVIAAVLVAGGRTRRPALSTALAGIAAGVASGLIATLLKAVTAAMSDGFLAAVATWQTWAFLIVGAGGFFLLQNALQAGRLVASQPGITLANPLVAGVWGVGLFHEQVRTGPWLLGAGLGTALLAAGAVLLSSSPLLEGHQESPDDDGQASKNPHAAESLGRPRSTRARP
jgi:drug/metabolite transporter (DMT)-like permease